MLEFFRNLFAQDFMPHGYCLRWDGPTLWLHVVSDTLIAAAYYSIPLALIYFVKRRQDLAFRGVFVMFSAFILACGTTHVMNVITLWMPAYRLDGLIKAITALLSVWTGVQLWPLIPKALSLGSPLQLEKANLELQRQIQERQLVEAEVRKLNAELEERVAQRTVALKRSNDELEKFAYISSHDLQEPLRMVTTYAQALAKKYQGKIDADADEMIGFVVGGAKRMHELINDLLTYSRVEQGGEFCDVPLAEVLGRVRGNLQLAIQESGAEITAGPLPVVWADQIQVGQVLENLISNAIKYRAPGRPARIRIGAERRQGEWRFSVRDNGIGFDPKYSEHIFVIFKRLHDKEYPGTGIGLAVCQRIVQRHGGRIWAESQPGEGSTFYFTLPGGSTITEAHENRHAAETY